VARRRDSGSAEPLLGSSPANAAWPRTLFSRSWRKRSAGRIWICPSTPSSRGAQQNFHQDRVSIFRAAHGRVNNGTLQVVASDPFDAAMMNAVRFDARMPVQFALAPKIRNREGAEKILRRRRRNAR
jgi:hypothetical protein